MMRNIDGLDWSVKFEMNFFFVFPILLSSMRRKKRRELMSITFKMYAEVITVATIKQLQFINELKIHTYCCVA